MRLKYLAGAPLQSWRDGSGGGTSPPSAPRLTTSLASTVSRAGLRRGRSRLYERDADHGEKALGKDGAEFGISLHNLAGLL